LCRLWCSPKDGTRQGKRQTQGGRVFSWAHRWFPFAPKDLRYGSQSRPSTSQAGNNGAG
jgi:hypothetical protein